MRQCLTVGYEQLAGELDGGIDAWRAAGHAETRTDLIGAGDLSGDIVDVRQRSEYETGHVPGALHVELGTLARAPLPEGPVTVMCGHGERAMTGASILEQRGRLDVAALVGGPHDWSDLTGEPLEIRE